MLEFYEFEAKPNMVFIPIPLYKSRERKRGFNQSGLIAEFLGKHFNIAVETKAVCRIKNTLPQIEMKTDYDRQKNIAGVFKVETPDAVKGKIVILIDDVLTSGATLEEAARVLKSAGAKSIWAAVVARR
ncbi:MAG: phosphoribosyltransferase family protein [bacterium]|nr:phosphoribosyltransferase family protein [bacterium]